ncbi:PAS domain-containing protein [Photobacterium rosenbergii]|uniref:PAS domain-containing protein n=1 Tax=Photobacterium rosenbergii TaxID=294936 RepID=A0ABU3ZDF0_9GAMM|nr:PAS domain-containing protein [Photobacterium rosenbergii]MDV5167934.1 PAS domain-containing protein [Photobacterium rosenbergii]
MNITDEQYLYAVGLKNISSPFPCAVYDGEGNYAAINRSYEDILGLKCEQVSGLKNSEIQCNFSDFADVIDIQNNHVLESQDYLFSLNIIKLSSGCKAYYVSKRPIINLSGKVVGIDVSMFNTGFIFTLSSAFNDPSMYYNQGHEVDFKASKLCESFTSLQETYAYFIMCGFSNEFISNILGKSIKTVENNMARLFDKAQLRYCGTINSRRALRDYLLTHRITNLSPAGVMANTIKTLTVLPRNSTYRAPSDSNYPVSFNDFGKDI